MRVPDIVGGAMVAVILATIIGLLPEPVKAETNLRAPFPASEKALNFSVVYGAQWIFYGISQGKEIREHGSFDNWLNNPARPHFDKDHFDYNIVKHTLSGNYYYLFYRSRGYSKASSFVWTTISSMAFEFTIETVTEQPSYQDLYQTPVFGTVMGIGMEALSEYCHSLDSWYGHLFGYLANPFSLVTRASPVTPTLQIEPDQVSASVSWTF